MNRDRLGRTYPLRGVITTRVRWALTIVLLCSLLLVMLGMVVFRQALELSWVDSLYFVITMMTSVGFGDFNLRQASDTIKLFGVFLMVIGPVALAATFGIVADYILRRHLEAVFGFKRRKMKDHVIVCGLGNVGIRVVEHLNRLGKKVVGVEKSQECRFLQKAKSLGVPVVFGDMREETVLEEAGLSTAAGLVAACDEDLVNLETGLLVQDKKPNVRVVLRIFDPGMAQRIQKGFGLQTAFSTSTLAAPAFAMAAVDPHVVGSFFVDDEPMLTIKLSVTEGADLDGMTTEELRDKVEASVLSHRCRDTGERTLHPSTAKELRAGDELLVAGSHEVCQEVKRLNGA